MDLEKMKSKFEEAYLVCQNLKNNTPQNDAEKLSHWILNTDISVYDIFIDSSDAALCRSIEGMNCMHSLISHAILDDGEISFVSFNGKPLIVRVDPRDFSDKESFSLYLHNINQPFNDSIYDPEEHCYESLNLSIDNFIKNAEQYNKEHIESCFLFDIQMEDSPERIEQIIKHYQSKDPDIITEDLILKAKAQDNWL